MALRKKKIKGQVFKQKNAPWVPMPVGRHEAKVGEGESRGNVEEKSRGKVTKVRRKSTGIVAVFRSEKVERKVGELRGKQYPQKFFASGSSIDMSN